LIPSIYYWVSAGPINLSLAQLDCDPKPQFVEYLLRQKYANGFNYEQLATKNWLTRVNFGSDKKND
jgi:hypothetical protein